MDKHGMVMVMGVTGAGKSTFVNLLKPGSVEVVHGLKSGSAPPQAVQIELDSFKKGSITVVDTPGFDDSDRSDGEIFQQITKYLAMQYALKIPLRGIIYLHQIHETRMRGSEGRYLNAFEQLCRGTENLQNVIFLTTRWDKVEPQEGLRREQQLIAEYWAPMLDKGAQVMRFPRSRKDAQAIILRLVNQKNDIVLSIQRELIDDERSESDTSSWFEQRYGAQMGEDIGRNVREDTNRERKKWKHKLQGPKAGISIFTTLLSLAWTVFNFASAFGGGIGL